MEKGASESTSSCSTQQDAKVKEIEQSVNQQGKRVIYFFLSPENV